MAAVWARVRADLRARWRAWLMLAILIGVAAGAVIAAAAGARRTDTAYQRFSEAEHAPNLIVFASPGGDPTFAQLTPEQLARLPRIAEVAAASIYPSADSSSDVAVLASRDGRLGTTIMTHKLLAGRLPNPNRSGEALVSFLLAERRHLNAGDRLSETLVSSAGGSPVNVSFKVVGIEASPGEFPPEGQNIADNIWATPAFWRAYSGQLLAFDGSALRLRGGARDVPALSADLGALTGGKPFQSFNFDDQAANTERSLHLQAVALWLLAGLLALVAALVVAQALMRQGFIESIDFSDLRALGMDRAQLWAVGMARAVVVGSMALPIAMIVGFLLSPLTPVGLARVAEPDPGWAADALALGLGAVATFSLVLAIAALPAWLAARSRREPDLAAKPAGPSVPSVAVGALSRAGASASVTMGLRLALEAGRGRSAVPVRSTLAGAVIGVTAVATALGFNASLSHLLDTPRLYGAPWDMQITGSSNASSTNDVGPTVPVLQADTEVADAALANTGIPLHVEGRSVQGITFERIKGRSLTLPALEGRPPSGARAEIMLGTSTLRAAHAGVGSTVGVSINGVTPVPALVGVVGRGVFPTKGTALGLGKGAMFTTEYGFRALIPSRIHPPPPDTAMVRLVAGVDRAQARASLQRRLQPLGSYQVGSPPKPVDLVNFGRVQNLPLVLAGLLAALAAATLAHLLVTSIRRRRRDLAVLKTLGFVPRQVRSMVAWQATTLGVVAAAVGIPLGVAAGRWAWTFFAHQIGVVPETALPLLALTVMIPVTLAVANLVALLPARAAANTRPAIVFRAE